MEIIDEYSDIASQSAARSTLAWVNGRRMLRGRRTILRLPKGTRYSIRDNPVARGIGLANVGLAILQNDGETDLWVIPPYVMRYLQLFHDGYLPEMERPD